MKKATGTTALWLLAALIAGCPPPKVGRPYWMVSRQHEDFPVGRYLLGVGEGGTPEEAEAKARSDVAEQVHRRLDAALREYAGSYPSNSWLKPLPDAPSVPDDAPAPTVGQRWQDSSEHRFATLVAWDLLPLAQLIRNEWNESEDDCTGEIAQGDLALSEGSNPYLALRHYLNAVKARVRAEEQRVLLAAFAAEGALLPPVAPGNLELVQKIAGFCSRVELKRVTGDAQQLTPEGALPQPLVVAVRLTGGSEPLPIADMPLVYRNPGAVAVAPLKRRTGALGLATATFEKIPNSGAPSIEINLDPTAVLADAGIDPADPRFTGFSGLFLGAHTDFRFLVPGSARIRVLVWISEQRSSENAVRSSVGELVSRALNRSGYEVIETRSLQDGLKVASSVDDLLASVKGRADVVVYGVVQASPAQAIGDSFVFSQANGILHVLEVESGAVLLSRDESVRGAGQDAFSADERALSNFVRGTIPALLDAIRHWAGKAK